MRPLWKGVISFGLVNIPVGLYSGGKTHRTIDFDMLRKSDLSRIHYKKVAEADDKEVSRDEIVKGYQYEKDKYIIVTPEDFERVQIASTQTIDIKEFVQAGAIDSRFYDEAYFLAPEKRANKAYALLMQALKETERVGIAKVVIRPPREHLAVVKPVDGMLMLQTMHFAEEVRDPKEFKVDAPAVGNAEMKMAVSLIDSMASDWKPEKYRDEYRDALMEVIEQKVKAGNKKLPALKSQKAKPKNVVDLVSVLQKSLEQAQGKSKSTKTKKSRKAA